MKNDTGTGSNRHETGGTAAGIIFAWVFRLLRGGLFLPFYRDVFRQFVLHKSNDEIGKLNDWRFHRDGIHLNSRSGKLLADLVQEFLDS